jgi:hypothetical protein
MTIQQAFERAGLKVTPTAFTALDGSACDWMVENSKGHKFRVGDANWGQFTVDALDEDGKKIKKLCTHCIFRTAVKLIKAN